MGLPLGQIGVMSDQLSHGDRGAAVAAAVELEELGYATIWLPGSQDKNLPRIAEVVRATRKVPVASGIIAVNQVPADAVARVYDELSATDPDRFIVGLGGAHGPKPIPTIAAYLDRLDTVQPIVPSKARVLAALGPRMLALARDRAAGAFPILVTPAYVAQARELLTADSTLVTALFVILETQPERAREMARQPIGFLKTVPAYAANFRRMGFTDDDIAHSSDHLIGALTAWGNVDAIAARVSELLQAGADQVALSLISDPAEALPLQEWHRLAEALIR
jgi:probable F420-dependent oxidoreductase